MGIDWKLAVAVRSDLEGWQKLNLTAFVASGIGTHIPDVIGEDYADASGNVYLPMFKHPVFVYAGDTAGLRRAFDRACGRGLAVSVYIDDLFTTSNDTDNRAAVGAVDTAKLSVAGFSVAGDRRQVDKVFDKLRLHP